MNTRAALLEFAKVVAARLPLSAAAVAPQVLRLHRLLLFIGDPATRQDDVEAAILLMQLGITRAEFEAALGPGVRHDPNLGKLGDGEWAVRWLPDGYRFRKEANAQRAYELAVQGKRGAALDLWYQERGYTQLSSLRAKLATPYRIVDGHIMMGAERWLSDEDRSVLALSPYEREALDNFTTTDRMRR